MSRTKNSRKLNGTLNGWDWVGKIFTKENIQTGVQVVQQVTDKAKNGGTVTYNGTDASITSSKDFMNYAIIGGIGLAAVYFLNKK